MFMSIPVHLTGPPQGAPRRFSLLDRIIAPIDRILRTLGDSVPASRPYPAAGVAETVTLAADRSHVGALMRVNHAGEIAAQALYQGQAAVARSPPLRTQLLAAGREELDHLDWCSRRIRELGARPSVLNPLWYAGSFAIGVAAGLAGAGYSLGFVAETERQVVDHLLSHLQRLPQGDARTRAIIEQMRSDEAHHGSSAVSAGGRALPALARTFMRVSARIMTTVAYRI